MSSQAKGVPASIEGSCVFLRPVTEADYSTLYSWRTDPEFIAVSPTGNRQIPTMRDYLVELQRYLSESITLLVVEKPLESVQGLVRAHDVNPVDGWAWLETYASSALRREPYRLTEAAALFIDYLFRMFPLRKLCAEVFQYNELVLRLDDRLGFRQCATLPEHVWYDGLLWDSGIYVLRREQWLEQRERLRIMLEAERDAEELLATR